MTKTMGKFNVTSKFDTQFNYEGYSKQCEVAFRDYMSWCTKSKAPKAIQTEYDRVLKDNKDTKTSDIFTLAITAMTQEEFEKATNKKVGAAKASTKKDKEVKEFEVPDLNAMMVDVGGEVVPLPAGDYNVQMVDTNKAEIVDGEHAGETVVVNNIPEIKEVNYKALYNEYKAGGKVADICKRENISKSTFYSKIKKFQ